MPRPSRWPDVVDAAARVFQQRGYHATRLEDIAEELGMHKGSLYNYIDSKEDLLLAVVAPPAARLLATLDELDHSDLPPSEKIRSVARSHAQVVEEFFPYVAVYVHEIAGQRHSDEWSEKDRRYVRFLVDVIEDGLRDGSFADGVHPGISAASLIGSLNWMTRWYRHGGELSAVEVADRIADAFLAGTLSRSR